jgi:hypothetical protein
MTIDDVTNEVEWSTSKLVRIENGQVGISVSDLDALLRLYGVNDAEHVDELKQLARATRQRTWWSSYEKYIPHPYREYIGAEADARQIRHYSPAAVPGLLQTETYAKTINEATVLGDMSADVAQARSDIRMLRQKHVLNRDDPPTFIAMVDEAVLRRTVGGISTMREQLDHLVKMASRETIIMIVIPLGAGAHPGLAGAFAMFEYHDPLDDDVVCLESTAGNIVVRDQPEVVARYRDAAERIASVGLEGAEAMALIHEVREDLDKAS